MFDEKKNKKQYQEKMDLSRLAEAGKSAPRVPENKAAKEFIVENVGGEKVSHPVSEKEVRFDHLSAKVVRRSPYFLHLPDPAAAPDAVEEKDESKE